MNNPTINKSIFLSASPETVWAFLTDKDKLAIWFFSAEADLKDQQDYALIETADDGSVTKKCWGKVLEMKAPSHLKYTFTIAPMNGAMTTVTWTLEEVQGGTKLSMIHEGLGAPAGDPELNILTALDGGWDKHLAHLRSGIA